MATSCPKIIHASVYADKITLVFNVPMKIANVIPPSVFKINDNLLIETVEWINNCSLLITLDEPVTQEDVVVISYTRPIANDNLALQSNTSFVMDFTFLEVLNFTPRVETRGEFNVDSFYPNERYGNPNEGYVDDFIQMYGKREAVQITNLDNPNAQVVNTERLETALRDAHAFITAYVTQAPKAGKLLVASTRKRTACIIARYYLDSVRRRKDVLEDYERAIKELDANANALGGFEDTDQLAIYNGGIMRTIQIPQIYDSESGKGFEGWTIRPEETKLVYGDDNYRNDGNLSPKYQRSARFSRRSPVRPQDEGGLDNDG